MEKALGNLVWLSHPENLDFFFIYLHHFTGALSHRPLTIRTHTKENCRTVTRSADVKPKIQIYPRKCTSSIFFPFNSQGKILKYNDFFWLGITFNGIVCKSISRDVYYELVWLYFTRVITSKSVKGKILASIKYNEDNLTWCLVKSSFCWFLTNILRIS